MMPIEAFLRDLSKQNIRIYLDDGRMKLNAPKGVVHPELLEEVKARKPEILAYLQKVGQGSPKKIRKSGKKGEVPLSFAQQRLWFLDELEGESTNYNLPSSISIKGKLDVSALEKAIYAIIDRHEILRTVFPLAESHEPCQVVLPAKEITLHITDLRNLSASEKTERISRFKEKEAVIRFDIKKGPLVRTRLLYLDDEEYLLLLTLHHIISDGWSIGVMVRELVQHYEAFQSGQEEVLPPLEIQYSDFTIWERENFKAAGLNKQLDYWRNQLAGYPELLRLPTDFARPPEQTLRGAKEAFQLGPDDNAILKLLAKKTGCTTFMILHAALAGFLAHYSGTEDIVIGTVVAGRPNRQLEIMIGFFVKTLALRLRLEGNPSFAEMLEASKACFLSANENMDIPFEQVVETVNPGRNLAYHPVFQVLLVLQNTPSEKLVLAGLELERQETTNNSSKFDLVLDLSESEEGLFGTLEYCTDLFSRASAQKMVRHLKNFLMQMCRNPETQLWSAQMMDQEELEAALNRWNQSSDILKPVTDTLTAFEEQVRRTPSAMAMRHLNGIQEVTSMDITYDELNKLANRWARKMQESGASASDRVGICIDRSINMVAAMIGSWKAGLAFVGFDPTLPAERFGFLLLDSRVHLLVSEKKYEEALRSYPVRTLWAEDIAAGNDVDDSNLGFDSKMTDPAYVVYTSGSTGKPKGIIMLRLNIANWIATQIPLSENAMTTMQLASIGFDVCYQEIFSTLNTGGMLLSVDEGLRHEPYALLRIIRDQSVSRLFLPFVRLQQLAEVGVESGVFPSCLREVYSAGEQLQVTPMIETFFAECGARLFNQYGPSEVPIATHYECPGPPADWPRLPPIGSPLPNNFVYLLNKEMQPVPQGVVGEFYLGGYNTAIGYLDRDELTISRFIANPFGQPDAPVLYKSGDLGRMLPDGNFEFWGRVDTQVKIRGFRVEPGEIENVIYRYPACAEAAVIAKTDPKGQKYLAAFVVFKEDESPDFEALRNYLAGILPDYMIPLAYLELDKIPTDANGKTDGRTLQKLEVALYSSEREYVAPATPVEASLAAIWEEVLGREHIGTDRSFFELGGHSLLATQVISRIRKEFQIELAVRELFSHPTIRALAEVTQRALSKSQSAALPAMAVEVRPYLIPLSFAQTRLWLLDKMQAGVAYNIPFSLELSGTLNRDAFASAFARIAERHEILRTSFKTVDGVPYQEVFGDAKIDIDFKDFSGLSHEERHDRIKEVAREAASFGFSLEAIPLFKIILVRVKPNLHRLFLTFHHIVFDGWSQGILVREFSAFYKKYLGQHQMAPAPLAFQYADFSIWQNKWLAGDRISTLENYWIQQFTPLPELLNLPYDFPVPRQRTAEGRMERIALDTETVKQLESLGKETAGSLFMTLFAIYNVFLLKLTGQHDIVTGVPIANRNQKETEGMIGFFVNALPLRINLSGDPIFADLLAQTRGIALDAFAHQDMPYEKLVERLNPRREQERADLFNTMFVMQNIQVETLELPDLKLAAVSEGGITAKYDLTLVIDGEPGNLTAIWEYSTELFAEATILRMARQFNHLLNAIAQQPTLKLSQYLLEPAEQSLQRLQERNQSRTDYPSDQTIPGVFASVVGQFAQKVALVGGEKRWTYSELDQRANKVASHLVAAGVQPGEAVAVFLERSPELIVAILGILKAGAAYFPLPMDYPEERLRYMADHAGAARVVTHAQYVPRLAAGFSHVIDISREDPDEKPIDRKLWQSTRAEEICYLLYTSGSTGKSKGVAIPHRAVIRLAKTANYAEFSSDSRFLFHSPLAFDASTLEIWACLLNGGELTIAPPGRLDLKALAGIIQLRRINVLWLTAGLFNLMVEQYLHALTEVRYLIVGGEALSRSHVNRYLSRENNHGTLINGYGPTENTTFSCCYPMNTPTDAATVPIGYPIPNSRAYLLDESLNPVPDGLPGEIYLAGDGLAIGYWKDEELTSARFPEDPFGPPGSRMYRSGDLGRYLKDGGIEFLGRKDDQVKIRGHRVEPGETSAAMRAHKSVEDAVVLAMPQAANTILVGFWVRRLEADLAPEALLSHLRESLPPYQVPQYCIRISSIPLNENGKADKEKLKGYAKKHLEEQKTDDRELTTREKQLAEIWESLLNLKGIGPESNFFDLGGHSLLAMKLVHQIKVTFGVELSIVHVFEHPLLQQQMSRIEELESNKQEETAIPRAGRDQYRKKQ